ncbi:tellurite resistance protein TehB [bacterium BMS3Abin02]|nr:tellurite resistance protein TehB [bacterium BMS3Abin02]HDK46069.1 class I SAM-dependent methyltransferase [Actinomycetota bacterium]HDL48634.1 class I SAM-dependent methyltransferase [Actinomycetota bacterium]
MSRETWNTRYNERELLWSAEPNEFLVTETQQLTPGRALDIGAGEGRNALWLAGRGWQVTAVDFSDVAIAKGREGARHRGVEVEWVIADLQTYIPTERSFDLVIEFYIHIPEPWRPQVWRRAADAVAEGGTLLVVGHDLSNLEKGHGGPQDPAALFTPQDVVTAIEGLDVLKAEQVIRHVDGRVAIDALVRARRGSSLR